MKVRRRIQFYGRVQGVGFRWKATQLARRYDLTGWVRNNEDGSVTMEVQGEHMAIFVMLSQLKNDPYIEVTRQEIKEIPIAEKEREFRPVSSWGEF
ncbi:MAG: acylphosphatase [Lachnospiraceae bacterium]|jgi:acylphosphatase|nr:acylphosphatase [Lachnospiraceae bacterium]MDY6333792.1 acylphosphatase [Lachnospiraceae bacterium]